MSNISTLVRLWDVDSIFLERLEKALVNARKIRTEYADEDYMPAVVVPPAQKRPGRRPRSLTSKEALGLLVDYQTGMKVKDIAKKYGCSRATIQYTLEKHDITRRNPNLSDDKIAALQKRRVEGATYAELVAEFGVSKRTISKYTADH